MNTINIILGFNPFIGISYNALKYDISANKIKKIQLMAMLSGINGICVTREIAIITNESVQKYGKKISIISIEKFPLEKDVWNINYSDFKQYVMNFINFYDKINMNIDIGILQGHNTDFLLLLKNGFKYIELFCKLLIKHGITPGVATHNPSITIPILNNISNLEIILLPFNIRNNFMNLNPNIVIDLINESSKTIMLMKVLSGGVIPIHKALTHLYRIKNLNSVIIGIANERELHDCLSASIHLKK